MREHAHLIFAVATLTVAGGYFFGMIYLIAAQ
jgi:hypothetical protein